MQNDNKTPLYPYDESDKAADDAVTAGRPYQDDLDNEDGIVDPVMIEGNEDPAVAYNLPAAALRDEFGQEEGAAGDAAMEDVREQIEDWNEADGSSATDEI